MRAVFFRTSKGEKRTGKDQLFAYLVGRRRNRTRVNWHLTDEEEKKLDTYWAKFKSYVSPKSNFRLARYKLRTIKQEKGVMVDSFLKRIRVLVNENSML